MATRDIIVIGASAGGIEALQKLCAALPRGLPTAFFVVLHVDPFAKSYLPQILNRTGPLKAIHAEDSAPIRQGHIYVAPPNRHLLIENGHIHLSRGPKENRHRPAINATFRSAALAYGSRVVGVVLSGALDDGTAGLWEIKRRGGIAIVQDPMEALFPDMPQSALNNVAVDYIQSVNELAPLLTRLVTEEAPVEEAREITHMAAKATRLTCPDCRGSLEAFQQGDLVEFRCRVNHTYSAESVLSAHAEGVERSLWAAVVALEEGADLANELAPKFSDETKARLEASAAQKRTLALQIQRMLDTLSDTESTERLTPNKQ